MSDKNLKRFRKRRSTELGDMREMPVNCNIGKTDNENMLDKLFSNFCIGK